MSVPERLTNTSELCCLVPSAPGSGLGSDSGRGCPEPALSPLQARFLIYRLGEWRKAQEGQARGRATVTSCSFSFWYSAP